MLTVGITGAGGGVGSAVLRSLSVASLPTRAVCFDATADVPGMHRGHRARLIPKANDPSYGEALLEACEREGVSALIPGLDPELEPLSRLAPQLAAIGCTLLCSSPPAIQLLRDKLRCSEYFGKLGLPFAHTVPLARADDLLAVSGFPLIAKPAGGSGSRGLRVVFDPTELAALATMPGDYILQDYLLPTAWGKRKSELQPDDIYDNHSLRQVDEIVVQVLIGRDRKPIGVFTSNNTLKDGATIKMRPIEHDHSGTTDAVLQMAEHLADLGLLGPCNFQCKVTAEGPRVFEINPRFSGGTGARATLGFNEVEACLRRIVLGESLDSARASLQTRFDRICGIHPAEFVVETAAIDMLTQGRTIDGQAEGTGEQMPNLALVLPHPPKVADAA